MLDGLLRPNGTGYAAQISGELEDELPGWEIVIGPREAAYIPAFLKTWKG